MNPDDTAKTPMTTEAPEDRAEREFEEEIDVVDEEEAEETEQIKAELKKQEDQDKGEMS